MYTPKPPIQKLTTKSLQKAHNRQREAFNIFGLKRSAAGETYDVCEGCELGQFVTVLIHDNTAVAHNSNASH